GQLLSPLASSLTLVAGLPFFTLVNYVRQKEIADRTRLRLAETQRQSRDAIAESESRYRRLVENINDAIVVDDLDGRFVFANSKFREWFGLLNADIRTVRLEDVVAPEWSAEV